MSATLACTGCGLPVDPVTTTDGETTHPTCEPGFRPLVVADPGRCPACGARPACGLWLVAGVRDCEPYPCRCAPRYGGNCRYKRCDCWGRLPQPHLPPICCAFHDENPAVAPAQTATTRRSSPTEAPPSSGGSSNTPEAPPLSPRATEIPGRPQPERQPACTCPTPWDGQKTPPAGRHCVDCHEHFVSHGAYTQHLGRKWGAPCRHPSEIVDCQFGFPLMQLSVVGGLPVWRSAPLPSRTPRDVTSCVAQAGLVG